jgi:hypothetical protein
VKKTLYYLVLLLAAGLILGFAGCSSDDDDETDFSVFYTPGFRSNGSGTVEVVNNTPHDMLLFRGETISRPNIIGGVKSGTSANVNFSSENDFTVGGFVLLRAVRQAVFAADGLDSAVDHTAMATYGDGRRFTTTIRSTTEGNFSYMVHNRSRDFGLELRQNSPYGQKVAYLTRGEQWRIINTSSQALLTVFPVWVAFNTQTKTIVTFAPAGVMDGRNIQPVIWPTNERQQEFFPEGGENTITFDTVALPFATIIVRNNAGVLGMFREATTIRTAESGFQGIISGRREVYEVLGGQVNLNIAFGVGQAIVVPVRFEANPGVFPEIENGFVYNVAFNHTTGQPTDQAASYTAWLVKGEEIKVEDLFISH